MSPSSNGQYNIIKRGSKTYFVASSELQKFKRHMDAYKRKNLASVKEAQVIVQGWLEKGYKLGIKSIFYFEKSRIFSKKDATKKIDVSNRIKALHDCFCSMIHIDDSLFFEVIAIKSTVDKKEHEKSDIFLYAIK